MTLSVGSIENAALEILRFGAHAEVVGPPELRARMAEIAGALARLYESESSPARL